MRQKGTVLKQQNIPLSLILVIVFLVVGIAGLDVALVRSYVRNIAEK